MASRAPFVDEVYEQQAHATYEIYESGEEVEDESDLAMVPNPTKLIKDAKAALYNQETGLEMDQIATRNNSKQKQLRRRKPTNWPSNKKVKKPDSLQVKEEWGH